MSNHNLKNAVQNFIHLVKLRKTLIKQINEVTPVEKLHRGVVKLSIYRTKVRHLHRSFDILCKEGTLENLKYFILQNTSKFCSNRNLVWSMHLTFLVILLSTKE